MRIRRTGREHHAEPAPQTCRRCTLPARGGELLCDTHNAEYGALFCTHPVGSFDDAGEYLRGAPVVNGKITRSNTSTR